jgi:GNAT superfamily N-acetyltransferase
MRSAVSAQLARGHVWFKRGDARHFMIAGQGRASAFYMAGDPVGHIGFFECVPDYSVAARLLDAAAGWLRSQGAQTVRGPVNVDTWHSYRFVTSGWEDHEPFLLEPYNPPYYPQFWERFGFRASARYGSHMQPDLPATVASLERHYRKSEQAGFRFRPLDLGRFEAELRLLYDLSREIFQENWGYRPIGFAQFADLYRASRRAIAAGLCVIAEHHATGPAGFVFGLPDLAGPVRAMHGRGGPLGAMRYLAARRKPEIALLKTIGVVPSARGTNLGFAMCYPHYRHALAQGYRYGIHALMIEANASRRMSEAKGGRPIREYAVFDL